LGELQIFSAGASDEIERASIVPRVEDDFSARIGKNGAKRSKE
jgi:hypothetical protein